MVSPSPFLELLPAIPALTHLACTCHSGLSRLMVTGQAVLACFPVVLVLVVPCQHWEPHEIPPCDCAQHRRASHHSGKSWKICLYPCRARVGQSSQGLPGLEDMRLLEQRHIHTFLTSHQKIQLSFSA